MVEYARRIERADSVVSAPVYLLIFPIPVVCFVGTLLTDVAYAASASLMWLHFSEWLNAVGLAFGAFAALALLFHLFAHPAIRTTVGWIHFVLLCGALLVELFNAFVHSIDGWTAVVPEGMTLSIIGAILAAAAAGALGRVPVRWMADREPRS